MGKQKSMKKVMAVIFLAVGALLLCGIFVVKYLLYPDVMKSGDGDIKIACVGDSITYGQGVWLSRKTDAYTAVLAELLGEEYQTLNYGLPNRTLQSAGNMPYFEERLAEESLDSEADIVIFMLGTNDTKPNNWNKERFEKEYKEAVEKYQSLDSHPQVYVMIPPQIFLEESGGDKCSSRILEEELAQIIPEIAEETGAEVIDLYTVTKDHPEWFDDGLHPNREGNRAIAEVIYDRIK